MAKKKKTKVIIPISPDKFVQEIDKPVDGLRKSGLIKLPEKITTAMSGIKAPLVSWSINKVLDGVADRMKKGIIKARFTHNQWASLIDLLHYFDKHAPEEEIFEMISKIFFKSLENPGELKYHQLLHIAKQLNSMDVLALKSCNEMRGDTIYHSNDLGVWRGNVAQKSGLLIGMVEIVEEKLENLRLITQRTGSDKSYISNIPQLRLTDLGIELCETALKKHSKDKTTSST